MRSMRAEKFSGYDPRDIEMEKSMQQTNQPAGQLYLQDLYVGQRFTSGTYLIEAARIKKFAAEFDPQPFHLNEAAAQMSLFKGLVASGWHTAAVAMRLLVTGGLPFANGIVGFGGELSPRARNHIRGSSRCAALCSIRTGKPFTC